MLCNFQKVTFLTPLDKHSRPKDPSLENKSKILELFRSIFILFE